MATINTIIEHNKRSGYHFFDADTMKWFGSKVYPEIYANKYFITSEKDNNPFAQAWEGKRRYTIRKYDESTGNVESIEFGEFATLATARRHAKKLQ